RLVALLGCVRDGRGEALALLGDLGRAARKLVDLARQLVAAGKEGRVLALGRIHAVRPGAMLLGDRGKPLAPGGRFAQQPVVLALKLELRRAALAEQRAQSGGFIAREGGIGQRGQRRLGLARGALALGEIARETLARLAERRQPRSDAGRCALQLGLAVARGSERADGLAR